MARIEARIARLRLVFPEPLQVPAGLKMPFGKVERCAFVATAPMFPAKCPCIRTGAWPNRWVVWALR